MNTLTHRQHEVSAFMRTYLVEHDNMPTTRQIAKAFTIPQTAAVDHLKALARQGVIEKEPGGRYRFTRKSRL